MGSRKGRAGSQAEGFYRCAAVMAEEGGMDGAWEKVRRRALVVGQVKGNAVLHRAAPGFCSDSYDLAAPYNKAYAALYGANRTLLYGALKKLLRRLIAVTAGVAVMVLSARLFHLRIVLTDSSAPAGIYRLSSVPTERDNLVLACLPVAVARTGLTRGYLG